MRADTLISTVKSIQRSDFPARRGLPAPFDPAPYVRRSRRPGGLRHGVYGLLLTFRGDALVGDTHSEADST